MIKLQVNTYKPHIKGTFLKRLNRFVAQVEVDGKIYKAHLHDSGRLGELLIKSRPIMLIPKRSPKTDFKVIAIYRKHYGWILLNSGLHRSIMEAILKARIVEEFREIVDFRPEYKIGNHRIDFLLRYPTYNSLMEVKGCTLFKENTCLFPDAPTKRGTEHLKILSSNIPSFITFLVCHPSIATVKPNCKEDPVFCKTLSMAISRGVVPVALKVGYQEGDIFFHGKADVEISLF